MWIAPTPTPTSTCASATAALPFRWTFPANRCTRARIWSPMRVRTPRSSAPCPRACWPCASGTACATPLRWSTRRAATARWWWRPPLRRAIWLRAWRAAAGVSWAGPRSTNRLGNVCSMRPMSASRKDWKPSAAPARQTPRLPIAPILRVFASWAPPIQALPSPVPATVLSAPACVRWSASSWEMRIPWRIWQNALAMWPSGCRAGVGPITARTSCARAWWRPTCRRATASSPRLALRRRPRRS